MIEKCTDAIADWLIRYGAIKKSDKELYSYASYSVFLSLSPLLLAIGFGICLGCIKQSMMIVIPFVLIRKFSGGYHTTHLSSCLLLSSILLLLCIVLSFHIKCGSLLAFITMGGAVSLICFSPIDNENRILNQDEHIRYKRITTLFVVFFLLLDTVLFLCQLYTYSICISISILLSAGLQLPCILKQIKK